MRARIRERSGREPAVTNVEHFCRRPRKNHRRDCRNHAGIYRGGCDAPTIYGRYANCHPSGSLRFYRLRFRRAIFAVAVVGSANVTAAYLHLRTLVLILQSRERIALALPSRSPRTIFDSLRRVPGEPATKRRAISSESIDFSVSVARGNSVALPVVSRRRRRRRLTCAAAAPLDTGSDDDRVIN